MNRFKIDVIQRIILLVATKGVKENTEEFKGTSLIRMNNIIKEKVSFNPV